MDPNSTVETSKPDICSLPNPTDESIVSVLHMRFKRDLPYTRIGAHHLIVVNTYKPVESLNDASLNQYAATIYRDLENTEQLQPHIYDLAARVYYQLRRASEDQSIVLSGVTGSGKTTSQGHLLKQLLHLSSHSKKALKLQKQIVNAQTILQQFGSARTVQNNSASGFGQFQELQYNERGRIIGLKTMTYNLDRSRLTQVPPNERNFHVFYSLLSGTSTEERTALRINHAPEYFTYLSQTRNTKVIDAGDQIAFGDLKAALKVCGFKSKTVTQLFQVLAAILHLGNLQFVDPASDAQDSCSVKNTEELDIIAAILGVSPSKLESTITYHLRYVGKELCTAFLNAQAAAQQRDAISRAMYGAIFNWIVEMINIKLCCAEEEVCNFVGILDQFGFQNFKSNGFEHFTVNFANEAIDNFLAQEQPQERLMAEDGVSMPTITSPASGNCMALLTGNATGVPRTMGGLIGTIDKESKRYLVNETDATDANLLGLLDKLYSSHACYAKSSQTFTFGINHYSEAVYYSIDSFLEKNTDNVSPDFINLLRSSSSNDFVLQLFQNDNLATKSHPHDDRTIIKAQLPTRSMRAPSIKRPTIEINDIVDDSDMIENPKDEGRKITNMKSTLDQLGETLSSLIEAIQGTRIYKVLHIRPNDLQAPDQFNISKVKLQVRGLQILDLHTRCSVNYSVMYPITGFVSHYASLPSMTTDGTERDRVTNLIQQHNWTQEQVFVGKENVWLEFYAWKSIEDNIRRQEKEHRLNQKAPVVGHAGDFLSPNSAINGMSLLPPHPEFHDDRGSYIESDDEAKKYEGSQWGEESDWGGKPAADGYGPNLDMSQMVDDYSPVQQEQVEEVPITTVRRWWVRFVWLLTWWIPSIFLKWCGGMKREDVRMAWREKVVLCFLIFMFSASTLFFIAVFGELVCPGTKSLYSVQDVANHNLLNDFYVSVRGKVYDVTRFAVTDHGTTVYASTKSAMEPLAGQDLSSSFPVPLTAGCPGLVSDDTIRITPNETAIISSFVHLSGNQQPDIHLDKMKDKTWIWDYFMPVMNLYKKGDLVIPMKTIQGDFNGWGRLIVSINDKVYDITDYMSTARLFPSYGPTQPNYRFLDPVVETIFTKFGGTDATAEWNKFKKSMTPEKLAQNQNCLDNVFYIGRLDYRDDARCTFTNYLLLAFALVMCFVTLIKFLAALQFGGVPTPEQYDKFVICQVPCYTEDEESIRKTINSITVMEYDDKRKLIFLIADGMIMGSGNDRPTPRIVLDILGHDPKLDPEPLMFKSIGEGSKQLNYGKVYSGLYEHEGHVVPYVVVVKVGKASERSKPGNRGKRDSQIICMNFLNKVHFESEMTPLELEMYHQIKNVIGVDPSFYEYVLMIDADTEVMPDALTRMISCLLHDGKIIGICGETSLGNEDNSWTTMIQVYEYYISHHLSKAFESLFGSVTCLPGCFCMYRIRTPNKNLPLIISPQVIQEYSENHVDTLHKKNLLHLGEDRYLTTLMMKHFPQYKMTFTPHAQCKTIAPDRWSVLLSQRRRWINSTIHNLLELVLLPELCGFCCFSMRFVVMIDLVGTLTLPSSVMYLVYLVYVVISKTGPVPLIALCMLAGIYGLQALIFIIKRQWQHIGWMIIYIFAIPIFSFFIPIYAFWHFDDFSWGNTRVVVGDKKKQIIVADDEKFDEKMIPLKKWSTYEHELWEAGSTGSKGTEKTGLTAHTYRSYHTQMSQGTEYRNRHGQDFDYYRDSVKTHKKSRQSNAGAHSPYAASYAGSDYLQKPPKAMSVHSYGEVPDHLLDPRGSTYSIPALSNHSIHSLTGVPTDAEIVAEIRNILATANLMTVTKKQVREQLSLFFGVDLVSKKEFISVTIESILQGRM
ncbi:hypothetical protein INT44_007906 [Umbelopsis vinacea]|uniref:chitin synthase n=1 Tax=Umbelopsis vinacea TaxID=44442 RepID=A0A8H7UC17_9FUNG|nr:hypothetical protein INT44_007906 [Umbelopsis vinacea]